jgi:hypothetical protein
MSSAAAIGRAAVNVTSHQQLVSSVAVIVLPVDSRSNRTQRSAAIKYCSYWEVRLSNPVVDNRTLQLLCVVASNAVSFRRYSHRPVQFCGRGEAAEPGRTMMLEKTKAVKRCSFRSTSRSKCATIELFSCRRMQPKGAIVLKQFNCQ